MSQKSLFPRVFFVVSIVVTSLPLGRALLASPAGEERETRRGRTAATASPAPAASPHLRSRPEPEESPFSEAELFLELNDTDGDLGIHSSIDGEPWIFLEVEDPNGRQLLSIRPKGPLRGQGMTQLFVESAEPGFDELEPAEFFGRFPEGEYEIRGVTVDGEELESAALLTHVLPAPPGNVRVSGLPAAESCDADPLPVVSPPVTVSWDPVTGSHPELGRPGPIEIVRYQLFVEAEGIQLGIDLPPQVTAFEIPATITAMSDEVKFEIIAREASGNNTAVESCFFVVD
jgi:hypothetical protein